MQPRKHFQNRTRKRSKRFRWMKRIQKRRKSMMPLMLQKHKKANRMVTYIKRHFILSFRNAFNKFPLFFGIWQCIKKPTHLFLLQLYWFLSHFYPVVALNTTSCNFSFIFFLVRPALAFVFPFFEQTKALGSQSISFFPSCDIFLIRKKIIKITQTHWSRKMANGIIDIFFYSFFHKNQSSFRFVF